MKTMKLALILIVAFAPTAFAHVGVVPDEIITTSKSTLTLPAIEGLNTENGLRQANRIAEIALGELTADGAALDQEKQALMDDVAAYDKKRKAEQALLDDPKGPYMTALAAYRPKLADHKQRLAEHNADAAKQRTEVEASNALAPEQRDEATVTRLNNWGSVIETRRVALDKERDSLADEYKAIQQIEDDANARLKAIGDPLRARLSSYSAKQGLAYRQLKQCAAYATQIRELLKTKYNAADTYSPLLDLAAERLKKLSGEGFDTP